MSDDEIRDFWMRSILEQYREVPPWHRHHATWRMSSRTRLLLMKILTTPGIAMWAPALDVPDTIVGRPIEIDENAEGLTLHIPARLR